MKRIGTQKKILARIALYVTVTVMLGLMLFPLYWMVRTSLDMALFEHPASFWPAKVGFDAYKRVFSRTHVAQWYLNSLYVTGLTLLLAVPCSAMAGYALSRFRKIESTIVGSLILLAKMLPISLLTIPLYVLFARLGLLNNLFCLVLANTTFAIPFCTWMLKGFFDGLPRELEEAAEMDGCSIPGSFLRIVLPLSAPGLAAASIYTAVISWGEYIFARTFMSQPANWTVTVGIVSFKQEYSVQWNDIMAASLVFTLPLMILFVILERYLVRGLTAGSIK